MRMAVLGGDTLRVDARMIGGRSHLTYRARTRDGVAVVVKTSGDTAALTHEFTVLRFLATVDYPAPRPLGLVPLRVDDRGWRPGLVLSWLGGAPPVDAAGWGRLGARLAQLHRLPAGPDVPLRPALAVADLPDAVRVEVGAGEVSAIVQSAARAYESSVFSHGDAGTENFLDTADGGALVDFESACRQPAGADLGRCLFLITDAAASDVPTATEALLGGYRADALPVSAAFRWAAVEGLRIAAWRYQHAGRPGVPEWRRAVRTVAACWRRAHQGTGIAC